MEELKPQSRAASPAADGEMTQSNICLNSAQIRHQRHKHHLQIKGTFPSLRDRILPWIQISWSGRSASSKAAHVDLFHPYKALKTSALFHQNNNSLSRLRRSDGANPPSEPLLTSKTRTWETFPAGHVWRCSQGPGLLRSRTPGAKTRNDN